MAAQEWTAEERADARRHTVEQLHAQLTQQIANLDSVTAWQRWLGLARSLHSYSFSNILLIAAQCPEATMVAGFGTWKQKGHAVRKGEKAIKVLAPILRKTPIVDEVGRPVLDVNGERRFRREMVGVKPVNVFDASQVEPSVETPPLPRLLTGQAPPGLWDSLSDLAGIEGYTVVRRECGTANGLIDFASREIRIRPDVDELIATKSLCHELGHALTMSPGEAESYTAQRELREVEAESVAFAVLGAHGVDTSQYTIDYVAGWAARAATASLSVEDIIVATGQRVVAAADRILTHTQNAPNLEDELVDRWARTVQPAPTISPEPAIWEAITEPSPPRTWAEQLAVPEACRRSPAVPR